MDFIPETAILQFNPNTLEEVRRDVNMHRPGELKEAVRILDEWIKQQPHFKKKDFPSHYLEKIILSSKGSLERAKQLLDNGCTTRTLLSHMFEPYNPKESFQHVWDQNFYLLLPKLTEDNVRIGVFKFIGKCKDTILIDLLYRYSHMLCNYIQTRDYNSKVVIIFDMLDMDIVDALAKVNLFHQKTFFENLINVHGLRVQRINVLTKSKVIDKFIAFFRPFIKKKLMDRVVINQSIEELYQYYPKDILPKDYGGYEKSLSEIHDEWINLLSTEEQMNHAMSMFEAQVDESLRPKGHFNEQGEQIEGTFRTLNID